MRTNLGDLWRAQGEAGRPSALRCYTEVLRLEVRLLPPPSPPSFYSSSAPCLVLFRLVLEGARSFGER